MVRIDGRNPNELRPLSFELDVQKHADGSCIVSLGDTRVLCAVTVEEQVPRWMRGSGRGWLTAEYNMLPAATNTRSNRERVLSAGRTKEIQRLIGRSLRAAVNLDALGERTFNIDCDVLDADGGTRTAAVTGAFVAVQQAIANSPTSARRSSPPSPPSASASPTAKCWSISTTPKTPPPTSTATSSASQPEASSKSRAQPRASRSVLNSSTRWSMLRKRPCTRCSRRRHRHTCRGDPCGRPCPS